MKFSKSMIAQAVGFAIAATAGSQAFAVPASNYNEATQVTLRIGGATATRPGLLKLFQLNNANNGICADNTLDQYESADKLQYLMICTGRVGGANPLPAALQGARIAVHKSDTGGSGNGVAPLVRNLGAALPDFFNVPTGGGFLNACAGVTTSPPSASFSTFVLHTGCTGVVTEDRVPDAGISDLEPAVFKSVFSPALTSSELNAIPANPISAVIFGITVTTKVRENMQRLLFPASSVCHPDNGAYATNAETLACQPSLTRGQLAALYTQNYTDWTTIMGPGGSVASPDGVAAHDLASSGEVYICRRVSTSGTQAVFETQLLAQRCSASVPPFATAATDVLGGHVFEGSGSGNVVSCMKDRFTAGQGGIGVLSMEFPPADTSRTASDSGYRYIKINGVAPCLLPTVQSKYDFLGESTMQWRTSTIAGLVALSGPPLNVATSVRDRIGAPAVVNDLNTGFSHAFCTTGGLGSGALVGNALSNAAGAAVPPFTVGTGLASDVVLHPIITKTRGVNGANSCGLPIDVLATELVN